MREVKVVCCGDTLRLYADKPSNAPFDLWCCRAQDVPLNLLENPGCVGWLSREELKRHSQRRFRRDRDLFLTTRLVTRLALSQYATLAPQHWQFRSGPRGRPEVTPEIAAQAGVVGLSFNASRSGNLAVCAISREGTIGVDVEDLLGVADATEAATDVLTESELLALNALPKDEQKLSFLEAWVLKEAFVKALGEGLYFDVKRIAFSRSDRNHFEAQLDGKTLGEAEGWHFTTFRLYDRFLVGIALHRT